MNYKFIKVYNKHVMNCLKHMYKYIVMFYIHYNVITSITIIFGLIEYVSSNSCKKHLVL